MNQRGEAVVPRRVSRTAGGAAIVVSAILDTGFTGALALPASTIATLGLSRQSSRSARLGDGTVRQLELFAAEVEWAGWWRPILVHPVGCDALIGTRLLNGSRSTIDRAPGGAVEIVLPRP